MCYISTIRTIPNSQRLWHNSSHQSSPAWGLPITLDGFDQFFLSSRPGDLGGACELHRAFRGPSLEIIPSVLDTLLDEPLLLVHCRELRPEQTPVSSLGDVDAWRRRDL
jgi:hypothetical protein